MAVYYDMGACFETEADANAFRVYWDGVEITLSNGEDVPFRAYVRQNQGQWCTGVSLKGMSIASPDGDNDKLLEIPYRDEIITFVYEHLKASPAYVYAMFGGECAEAILFEDFHQDLQEDPNWRYWGLVVSDAFWERLGMPDRYEPFCDGYRWCGYPKMFS